MIAPEKSQICTSTKMDAAFDLLLCGLCGHLVQKMDYEHAPIAM